MILFIKRNIPFILCLLVGALFLMLTAFQNGYPLIFVGDTGGYLKYAFLKDHTHDGSSHSFLYGLFIGIFSLNASLFFVAFTQCLLCSYVIFKTVDFFSIDKNKVIFQFLLVIAILSFFTGITKYTGKIMPDVFSGILILTSALLIFNGAMSKSTKILLSVVFLFSVAFHTSHLFIIVISLVVYSGYTYFLQKQLYKQLKSKFIFLGFLILLQIILVITVHYSYTKEIYYSKGKHIFLIGRMSETGILNDFLGNNKCVYRLCKYKNTKFDFNTFVWNLELSPTYIEYGNDSFEKAWKASEKDYNNLIKEILTTPKYLYQFLLNSISTSFSLLFNSFGPNEVNYLDGWTEHNIGTFLDDDLYAYRTSLQSQGKFLEIEMRITSYQSFVVLISIIIILYLFFKFNIENTYLVNLVIFVSVFFVVNAFICGTFSGLYSRYQERILWLIPFAAFLLLINRESKAKI